MNVASIAEDILGIALLLLIQKALIAGVWRWIKVFPFNKQTQFELQISVTLFKLNWRFHLKLA